MTTRAHVKVRLAICPLWERSSAELAQVARGRGREAERQAADRRLEDEWRARVARNVMLRRARAFIASAPSMFHRKQAF